MTNIADKVKKDPSLRFLLGKGEMRQRIREFDWRSTELGDLSQWPATLKTALSIMLDSATASYIAWGPGFIQFYNDAYTPILGPEKHRDAIGQTTPYTWHEIWDVVGPLFQQVLQSGQAIFLENHLFPMLRSGYLEECYFSFSYSPLMDEQGQAQGIFATVWETTQEFVSNRRKNAIRLLAQELAQADEIAEVQAAFEKTVLECGEDLPFGLWYERRDSNGFDLKIAAGLEAGSPLAPRSIEAGAGGFYSCLTGTGLPVRIELPFEEKLVQWSRQQLPLATPHMLRIKPLVYGKSKSPDTYLILGINPLRPYDETQRDFLQTLGLHIENTMRRINVSLLERREQEHQFQAVMAVLPCLVWLSDTNHQCIFVNQAWLRFTGRSFEQETGEGWLELVHPEDIGRIRQCQLSCGQGPSEGIEFRLRGADNVYHWFFNQSVPRYGMDGQYLGRIGTCIDITERKAAEQLIYSSQAELHNLYSRLQKVREEERRALAREVHDQLGQVLSAAKIDIKLLEDHVQGSEDRLSRKKLQSELASARQAIERAIEIVRRLAFELRPPELENQGLLAAIQWHLQDFERRTRIRCHLSLAPALPHISTPVALVLFGVFQEASTNILRHSRATEIWIMLEHQEGQLHFQVRDNGIGIGAIDWNNLRTFGLRGMAERVASINGRLTVLPAQPSGAVITVTVPYESTDESAGQVSR